MLYLSNRYIETTLYGINDRFFIKHFNKQKKHANINMLITSLVIKM